MTRLQNILLLIKQKGSCIILVSFPCHGCVLNNVCGLQIGSLSNLDRLVIAKKMLSTYTQEEIFEELL